MSDNPQKIPLSLPSPASENLRRLADLFPSIIKDGEVDFTALKEELGIFEETGKEQYELTWAGKQQAKRIAAEPVVGRTLKYIPEESKNADTTENLYIEGDNLEVLKLLQNGYMGKIKMIYIDPPYNTGKDFVYRDNFAVSARESEQAEGRIGDDGERFVVNSNSSARYHANWLSMMYPRLRLAVNLLRDDGVIFISIDDNEVHNLRKICDEIFGEENFVAQINWKGRGGRQDSKYYAVIHEYIFCYTKNIDNFVAGEEIKSGDVYPKYDKIKGRYYKTQLLRKWGSNSRKEDRPNLFYPIKAPDGSDVYPMLAPLTDEQKQLFPNTGNEGCWRWGVSIMEKALREGRIEFVKRNNNTWIPYEKMYAPLPGEEKTKKYVTWIDDVSNGTAEIKELFISTAFDYAKSTELIKRFINMANTENDDIILDFFSGSATTAHAVMQLNAEDGGNRKFIMVQLPEPCKEDSEAAKAGYKTICEIGKERIRRAGEKIKADHPEADIDTGFKVLRTADTNIRWIAAETGQTTLEDVLLGSGKDLRDFMPGTKDLDVVYEILLRQYDIPLTANIEQRSEIGPRTYSIADTIIVCLEETVTEDIISKLAAAEPVPHKIILRDSAFADDISLKENAMMRLDALMQKHSTGGRLPYTVEFL